MGLIGGDWGTSNLRVFRFAPDGQVIEQRKAAKGVMAVADGAFEAVLADLVGDWLAAAPSRVLLCGMIGSRQGWAEAPYLACPAGPAELAANGLRVESRLAEIHIVPGLSTKAADGRMDVMRGEETGIFGALAPDDREPHLVIAPGTHSKWAHIEGGRIAGFSTFMTGELYAVLRGHSILGRLMRGEAQDDAAFDLGVRRALDDPALSRLLFSARTEGLFDRIAAESLGSYLSGLLIGSEVGAGLADEAASAASVIAAPATGALYARALALAGLAKVRRVDGAEAAARGLWRLARAGLGEGSEGRP